MKKHLSLTEHEYISVHARVGIGVGEAGILRFSGIKDIANNTVRYAEKRKLTSVFMATDTTQFVELFEESIQSMNASFRIRSVPWKEGTGHIKDDLKNKTAVYPKEKLLRTFSELYLVGNSQTLLYTGSGFSHLAYRLGTAKKIVRLDCMSP